MQLPEPLRKRIKHVIDEVYPANLDVSDLFPEKYWGQTIERKKREVDAGRQTGAGQTLEFVGQHAIAIAVNPANAMKNGFNAVAPYLWSGGKMAAAAGSETVTFALDLLNQEFASSPLMHVTNMTKSSAIFAFDPAYHLDKKLFEEALESLGFSVKPESENYQEYQEFQKKGLTHFSVNDLARVSNSVQGEIMSCGEIIKRELENLYNTSLVTSSEWQDLKESFQKADSEIMVCIRTLKFIQQRKKLSSDSVKYDAKEYDAIIQRLEDFQKRCLTVYDEKKTYSLNFEELWLQSPPLLTEEKHTERLYQFVAGNRKMLDMNTRMQLFSYCFYILP